LGALSTSVAHGCILFMVHSSTKKKATEMNHNLRQGALHVMAQAQDA